MRKRTVFILFAMIAIVLVSGCEGPKDDSTVAAPETTTQNNKIYDLSLGHPVQNICLKNVPPEWGQVISTAINDNNGYAISNDDPSITITFQNGHILYIYGFTEFGNLHKSKFEVNVKLNCS